MSDTNVTIHRGETPSPLMALTDVARLAGSSRQAAWNWANSATLAFPAPVAETGAGHVYLRSEVEEWLRDTGRIS